MDVHEYEYWAKKIDKLTDRELEVCIAAANGEKRQKIADDLGISLNTVKTHLYKARWKLEIDTTAHVLEVLSSVLDWQGMNLKDELKNEKKCHRV